MALRFFHLIALLAVLLCPCIASAEGSPSMRPSEHRGIERARAALAQKEYAEAIAALEPLLEREERHPLVDFYRGVIAQSRQDYAAACTWFEHSVAGDPTLRAGWINLAQCYFQLREYAGAAQAFERSYVLSEPYEPRWRYNAALAWYQAGKLEHAKKLILQLLQDFPDAVELKWRELLVHIYLHQDGQEGEQNLRLALPHVQILAQESTAAAQQRWREYLIHLYLQLDMPEKALNFVTHLLELEILEPRWWRIAAHLHQEAQSYAEALVALQVVGFLAPGDVKEESLRADLCMHLGIPAQAIPSFTTLLERDTSDIDRSKVLLGLAQAYIQRHKPQEALKYLEQLDPVQESVSELRLRARILYMLEDYAPAYTAYVELARRGPQPRASARAWLFAGYAAWHTGELKKAQTALQHAAQEPEISNQAQQLLRHLQERGRRE
ncbi:MAG: tetratricopeptide repeat protein [Geobacteraceae bacterium]|nr:tetratricopeptide repeat protein [Geobacteraceae bacterium]